MVFKESFMRKNILMIIIVIFMALGYSELFQNKESVANKEQKIKEISDINFSQYDRRFCFMCCKFVSTPFKKISTFCISFVFSFIFKIS